MVRVPPGPYKVSGLDISHYQGNVDFKQVRASGIEFVFAKCSEYVADDKYVQNKAGAKAAGLLFGAYHFFHPSKDPKNQAETFLRIAKLGPGDLPPVLDWESTDNVPSSSDRARGKTWLDLVEKAYGKPPIIYGGPYFLQALGLDESFKRYPLWVAHYGTTAPLVPAPWKSWAFWQFSDKGVTPGVPGAHGDADVFNGPLDALKKYVI